MASLSARCLEISVGPMQGAERHESLARVHTYVRANGPRREKFRVESGVEKAAWSNIPLLLSLPALPFSPVFLPYPRNVSRSFFPSPYLPELWAFLAVKCVCTVDSPLVRDVRNKAHGGHAHGHGRWAVAVAVVVLLCCCAVLCCTVQLCAVPSRRRFRDGVSRDIFLAESAVSVAAT